MSATVMIPRWTGPMPASAGLGAILRVDEPLLHRVAAGELAAMQDCIKEYGGLVWSLARRFCASEADAEDAVQEIFIALWENAGRYDPDIGAEVTYVAMIARRRLIDRIRKLDRQQRLLEEVKSEATPQTNPGSDVAATSDEVRRAAEAMNQLSEDQRRVLTLSLHYGLTHEQIASHLGMPLGTVKTHARRGMIRVRDLLRVGQSDQSVGSRS